ncbi:UNKNOWN [Stylonychia lemnae]|uniref:Ion transport domain-containing protein n=1 Tax=Stylonychia lemnae TaxID=5949 RepID=A0A078B0P0_STYLE|nr:UNKNOWN [Stylonychia lemnae]|eukprot:CDW88225.1 UNKNOWN [Stylonychia lemnae]
MNNSKIMSSHSWLEATDQNSLGCKADDYFRDVSYYIDLQNLYKIVDTCYYSEQMQNIPVLVQIMQEKVRKAFGGAEYLLQVWKKIKVWNVTFDYLLFIEEGSPDVLNIFFLLVDNKVVSKVKGFKDPQNIKSCLLHLNYLVIIYNDNKIVFYSNVTPEVNAYKPEIDLGSIEGLMSETYQCELPIKSVIPMNFYRVPDYSSYFQMIVAFETKDNLLDFNYLDVSQEPENLSKFIIRVSQARDLFPRPVGYSYDPIDQCSFRVMNKNFSGSNESLLYAIAKRNSGMVDIYFNMIFKQQIPEMHFTEVGMSDHTFYFRSLDDKYFSLKHQDISVLSFEQAEEIPERDNFNMSVIPLKISERYAKLFSSFHMIMVGTQTICFIAHQNFVSAFDLIAWRWVNHIQFESNITQLFFQKPLYQNDYKSCVFLESLAVYTDISKFIDRQDKIIEAEKNMTLPFAPVKYLEIGDTNDDSDAYLVLHDGLSRVVIFNEMQMIEHDTKLKDKYYLEIVQLQTPKSNRSDGYKLVVYCYFKFYLYNLTKTDKVIFTKIQDINVQNDQGHYLSEYHSAFSLDVANHIILFNKQDALILDLKQKKTSKAAEVNCQGFILFNRFINYALCLESTNSTQRGLKMIDTISLSQTNEIKMLLLKEEDIGAYTNIYFDSDISRICFMKSVQSIIVLPYLHTNINKFMGMGDLSEYIFHKVIDHKLIALRQKGELVTWDVANGKYLCSYELADHDYTNFTKFTLSKDRAIMFSNEDEKNYDDTQFFTSIQLATSFKGQIPVIEASTHSFKRFLLLDIIDSKTVKVMLDFVFPKFHEQKMFINEQTDRMIVQFEFQRIFIYKLKENYDNNNNNTLGSSALGGTTMQWELIRQITDYPYSFDNPNTVGKLEPFTIDFKLYIRYAKKNKRFLLKYSDTGEIHSIIPEDLLYINPNETQVQLMNRFKWIDCESFIFTDIEGYEKIVRIRDYSVIAYNYRPLFNEISGEEWREWPYYGLRCDLKQDILSRLKRMYQKYKTLYYLHGYRDHHSFYKELITVDQHNFEYYEHSFTFLHWSLMDQMKKKNIKLKQIQPDMIEFMIYNILPGGNTILHKLFESQDKVAKLFKTCHTSESIVYHIPFLQNFNQASPFDLSLELNQKDFKSVFSVLQYLGMYPIDHHSRAIKGSLHVMVEQEFPEFLEYLETRFIQTHVMEEMDEGQIENEIITSSVCMERSKVKQRMLNATPSEAKIRIQLLDIPGSYHYLDPDFIKVFKGLAQAETYEIFDNRAIKTMIDFNFPIVRNFLLMFLILPFTLFHISFVVYMNVIYEYRIVDEDYILANYIFAIFQLCMCAYFLFNEIRQIYNIGLQYLYSVWNYIDLLAPTGVAILHGFQFAQYNGVEIDVDLNRCVLAISTFLMWLKFLSSLRIFKQTGYLIRMIVEVIYDMGIFLFVLLITVAAFGDSFLRISWGNVEENQFTSSFVYAVLFAYSMILGGYDTSVFGEVAVPLVWIFWILCTILDMIVMLNLLIAIISSTFDRVNENQEQASYQEMASLISENHYLIPKKIRQDYAQMNVYLLTGQDLEKIKEFKDPMDERFNVLKERVNTLQKIFQDEVTQAELRQQKIIEKQSATESIFTAKLGEIKLMMLTTMPKETANIKLHKNQLVKTTLFHLREKDNDESKNWYCTGKNFANCRSGYGENEWRTVDDEKIFHCAQCKFDLCAFCSLYYTQTHIHELKEITFAELKVAEPAYTTWACNGRAFPSCTDERYSHEDPYEYLWADYENLTYFCNACVKINRVIKA